MNIAFPENTEEVIDAIRGAIGRDVIFYYVASSIPCSACILDPITNTSTDSFCEICSGNYWIDVISGYVVSGHITWKPSDILRWAAGGQYFEGDCLLQVKYTDEMITVLDQLDYVEVDNRDMVVKSTTFRGVKNLNRILLSLDEKEK